MKTKINLESAFAGESMAYQKYLYFAKLAREMGNEEVALLFEDTAKHETGHAHGHLNFLYPKSEMTVEKLLEIAIKGETFEYTEMYPGYVKEALEENDLRYKKEFDDQIGESKEHAENFAKKLEKISKVFAGLAKIEQAHAKGYQDLLDKIKG
jgi:rubrerythrin